MVHVYVLFFPGTDTDECDAANGGCEDTCENTPGSYYCTCDVGYGLAADRHACIGMTNILPPIKESLCAYAAYSNMSEQLCDAFNSSMKAKLILDMLIISVGRYR